MPKKILLLAALILTLPSMALAAAESERTLELSSYKCKLTLPSGKFDWLEPSPILKAVAAMGDDSEAWMILMIHPLPEGLSIQESYRKGFENGFAQSSAATVLESKTINFKGAPCFEIHARLDQDGSVISVRALAANGHIYQLMVMGSDLPVEKRGELEVFFSAFDRCVYESMTSVGD
jgi:hypothetical protein